MKREQAYLELGLDVNSSEEEVKKRYKDLSKKYHPDVNKEPDANDKFKKINEAFTRIKNQDFEQEMPSGFSGFGNPFTGGFGINIQDLINGFSGFGKQSNKRHSPDNIKSNLNINFKESIFGCQKELVLNRKIKCEDCDGQGSKNNNGCTECNGIGRVNIRRGNAIITTLCNKCRGKMDFKPCNTCNEEGVIASSTKLSINVPPGIENDNVLRLSGMGNYFGGDGPFERYTDAHVHVQVDADKYFSLKDNNLISYVDVSLLDAIRGCVKEIRTLEGKREIELKPMSKNKDEIVLPNLGVGRQGSQIVILNVEYPKNIDSLVSLLESE